MTAQQATEFQILAMLVVGLGMACAWLYRRYVRPMSPATPHTTDTPLPQRSKLGDGRRWLLVGAPGTGKSTAARSMVRGYLGAGAEVIILDPEGSAWPAGARMVGAPDDYPAIGEALTQLQVLAGERRAQFHRGVRVFDPVLIVVDETPSVLRSTPGAIETIADLARRGRKLAISIVLLCQDTQAKTLGLEGQTKLLSAFDRLDCRMTPAGVELLDGDVVRTVARLDYDADDLVLPLVEAVAVAPAAPVVARPTRIESVEQVDANRILRDALGIDERNAATAFASTVVAVATPQTDPIEAIAQRGVTSPNEAESLPPDVAQRIAVIDWRTVAELVEVGALGETAALKALGFPASSTSVKYRVARDRLQAARAALREVSAKG